MFLRCNPTPLAILAACLAVSVLGPSPIAARAQTAPPIAWTPTSVALAILPGETRTVPLSFTVSEDLCGGSLHLTPHLRDFVTVKPRSFGSIREGEQVMFALTVSGPKTLLDEIFDGAVQFTTRRTPGDLYGDPLPISVAIEERKLEREPRTYPSISLRDAELLMKTGKIQFQTVPIGPEDDISTVRQAGGIIVTYEPTYVVVMGDRRRMDALRSLGLRPREPVERDYKLRAIDIWIDDAARIPEIQRIIADLWPVEIVPGYLHGRALDYQIERLRDEGYEVRLKSDE